MLLLSIGVEVCWVGAGTHWSIELLLLWSILTATLVEAEGSAVKAPFRADCIAAVVKTLVEAEGSAV